MAFDTIALDGFGLFAACDGIADSAGGTWAELGGGSITYEVTNPYVGAGSIGHEYASKSGFGYFISNSTLDFTPGTGAQAGELIYPIISIASSSAFDTLANNGFSFVVGTDTSNYRTYKLVGNDANNGWSDGWKALAIDPTVAGSIADVGTFDLANIKMIGLWMDTVVSVRAPTIFIDYVTVAKGIKVTGTGTLRELINYCTDRSLRAWPILQEREGIAYGYGKITAGDNVNAAVNTVFTDDGEVVQFGKTEFYHDTNGWSFTHPVTLNQVTAEKHASYTTEYITENTNLFGNSIVTLNMSNDVGAVMSASGGQFKNLAPVTMNSAQSVINAVLSGCSTRNVNGGVFNDNTVNTSDTITATSAISGNTVYHSIGAVSVTTAVLSNAVSNDFTSDSSNHAIELTTFIADDTVVWDNTQTDYDTAPAYASPITTTNTGNEALYISGGSGTITVSVAEGATPPSIRAEAGITVNLVGTLAVLTLSNIADGTRLVIVNSATRNVLKTVLIDASGTTTYTHSGGEIVDIMLTSLAHEPNLSDIFDYELPSSNVERSFSMIDDVNYLNP